MVCQTLWTGGGSRKLPQPFVLGRNLIQARPKWDSNVTESQFKLILSALSMPSELNATSVETWSHYWHYWIVTTLPFFFAERSSSRRSHSSRTTTRSTRAFSPSKRTPSSSASKKRSRATRTKCCATARVANRCGSPTRTNRPPFPNASSVAVLGGSNSRYLRSFFTFKIRLYVITSQCGPP